MAGTDLIAELEARNLIHDSTDRDALRDAVGSGQVAIYYGCDPTADSLHVGNLIGLIMLRRFQDAGHRPIALAGGATGMVGDPSGRSDERNLLDDDTLNHNVAAIKAQLGRIVELGDGRGELVDNRDWTQPITLLEFLRDVGKHVTVNQMLARRVGEAARRTANTASPSPSSATCSCRPTTTSGCTTTWLHDPDRRVRPVGQHHGRRRSDPPQAWRARATRSRGRCSPQPTARSSGRPRALGSGWRQRRPARTSSASTGCRRPMNSSNHSCSRSRCSRSSRSGRSLPNTTMHRICDSASEHSPTR